MLVNVVSVRDTRPDLCIYVGRKMPVRTWPHACHALANPFRLRRGATDGDKLACLAEYEAWLARQPDRDELLAGLAHQVHETRLPLGCWCGTWSPLDSSPPLLCHAVVLAREVMKLLATEGAST